MRELFGAQLLPVAAAVGPDPAEAARRAGLVASQMLGLALCRFVLRLPPVVGLPAEEAAAWLGPTIQRYLTDPSPAGPAPSPAGPAPSPAGPAPSPAGPIPSPAAQSPM
jgi:hypothetical protein